MAKASAATPIANLFHIPSRFLRSVQLERDFFDPTALDNYIVTPVMTEAFKRLAAGLGEGSGRRAWRVTGDYGVGKSSFALVLANLLASPQNPKVTEIADAMNWPLDHQAGKFWPVLVTGAREGIVGSIARGLSECLRRRLPAKGKAPQALTRLIEQAEAVQHSGDPIALEALLNNIRDEAASQEAGVLLIVDEMGKLLEYAAQGAGVEDVFVLQRLAEMAARSSSKPFLFLGLLHQGFQAYTERLPTMVRQEWDKVAGRFEEIVFDQPLAHTAALVAGALGVRTGELPSAVNAAAQTTAKATATMGWLSGATTVATSLQTAALYPIHPTLLPPLVRFFARYGQHERSLFGFLLSSEPFALQAFAAQPASDKTWYGLAEFYDYVRTVFGHHLSGGSFVSYWVRIAATVDTAQDLSSLELRVLKTVSILNLLDAEDLTATDQAILACLSPSAKRDVEAALTTLIDRGLLFRRGAAGGYRLWPNSSLNLLEVVSTADRVIGRLETVAPHLEPFLEREPLLARRHYVERGTMRFFEVRYAAFDQLERVAAKPTEADGLVLIALADTEADRAQALVAAKSDALTGRESLVVGVAQPLLGLASELHDLKRWQWVSDHTPELNHDTYARAEVDRQLAAARRALVRRLGVGSALRQRGQSSITWLHQGETLATPQGLSTAISNLCDNLFRDAPRVANELLNRNTLSSPAAAARMRLIEGMFNTPEAPFFGIDQDRAPPEKSMYLSVIKKGKLHEQGGDDRFVLSLPDPAQDELRLTPVINEIINMLETSLGERVPVTKIFEKIAGGRYGVRAGLAPILLALVVKVRQHELAIYEDGTFRASFNGQDFVRLIKAPASFDLQHCRLEGVRAEVFSRLAVAFTHPDKVKTPQILDVVRELCKFAAQLPEYTRKAGSLQPFVAKVRDTLLTATEPSTMLFQALPVACGLEPFTTEQTSSPERVTQFLERLQEAMEELRADYPRLLKRFIDTVAEVVSPDAPQFDRGTLASRAARVGLAAKLPRLRTFANRLRDPGTSDESWAEALASFIISKPPARWSAGDEERCLLELASLGELFHRVEFTAFDKKGDQRGEDALRINLTRANGIDRVQVITDSQLDPKQQAVFEEVRKFLPNGKDERLQFLTKLLWDELSVTSTDDQLTTPTDLRSGAKSA
ncbi:hypothetical protein [Caulobacter endophyticus]|uniref:ATP-binding protein n=1 Tax=Caulobacter endophyticus TaxID=2172652 RepID=A0A2T9K3Y6_9CAUL|nr:hypothetical protein [Caulobacter endophyticus]PVM90695.1 hypothetical protein DDF67_09705 [Caulobacter endophyticus]